MKKGGFGCLDERRRGVAYSGFLVHTSNLISLSFPIEAMNMRRFSGLWPLLLTNLLSTRVIAGPRTSEPSGA